MLDINCDMGESYGRWQLGDDVRLMDYVTSVNIACGFHAGDPVTMSQTVAVAVRKGLNIGAHPSYPDLQGFGRRKLDMTPAEIEAAVLYQIGALAAFVQAYGGKLKHVKPHGALYNVAAVERPVAEAIAKAVARFSSSLILVGLATSTVIREAAEKARLQFAAEAFADRAYNADGTLVSRHQPGSLLTDPADAVAQVRSLVERGEITAKDGTTIRLEADTICIHGDGPTALPIAQALHANLLATPANS